MDLEGRDVCQGGRFGKEWVPRVSDETWHGNPGLVRPRTLHLRVAEGKEKMDPFHPAASPRVVGRSGFDATSVRIAPRKERENQISHDAFR